MINYGSILSCQSLKIKDMVLKIAHSNASKTFITPLYRRFLLKIAKLQKLLSPEFAKFQKLFSPEFTKFQSLFAPEFAKLQKLPSPKFAKMDHYFRQKLQNCKSLQNCSQVAKFLLFLKIFKSQISKDSKIS